MVGGRADGCELEQLDVALVSADDRPAMLFDVVAGPDCGRDLLDPAVLRRRGRVGQVWFVVVCFAVFVRDAAVAFFGDQVRVALVCFPGFFVHRFAGRAVGAVLDEPGLQLVLRGERRRRRSFAVVGFGDDRARMRRGLGRRSYPDAAWLGAAND